MLAKVYGKITLRTEKSSIAITIPSKSEVNYQLKALLDTTENALRIHGDSGLINEFCNRLYLVVEDQNGQRN